MISTFFKIQKLTLEEDCCSKMTNLERQLEEHLQGSSEDDKLRKQIKGGTRGQGRVTENLKWEATES